MCSAFFGTVSYAEMTLLRIIEKLLNVNVKDKRINLTSDDIQLLATEYINSAEYDFWLDCAIDDAEVNNEMICDVEVKYKWKCELLNKLTGNVECLIWSKLIKEELLKRKSDARKSGKLV